MQIGISISLTRNKGVGWSAAKLFANGELGAWYDPSDAGYVFTDSGLGTRARFNGNVKGVLDKSPNAKPAIQTTATSTIRYYRERETSKPWVGMALQTDALNIDFGVSLGSACTIAVANRGGIEILEGQTVGSTYAIQKGFWQYLIIDRALTVDEKAALRAAWRTLCPAYHETYDVHVRASGGSDANDGLTYATAKATILAGHTVLRGLASGASMAIWPGTYAAGLPMSTSALAKTQTAHCPEPGVIIDLGETPNVGTNSGFSASSPNYDFRWYANGNLKITNCGNNAIGGSAGTARVYDALVDTSYDGTTAHTGSDMLAVIGVTIKNCLKGAFTHVGVCGAYHEQSVFYSKIGSVIGIGSYNRGVSGDPTYGDMFYQCDLVPDPDITTVWTSFTGGSGDTDTGDGSARVLRQCRLGAPHRNPTGSLTAWAFFTSTLEDCYMNGVYFQNVATAGTTQLTRCFGKASPRARRTSVSITNIDNCVFVGAATASHIISADFYSSPTDVFGGGRVQNSILMNVAVAIYAVSNASVLDLAWQFLYNCFYNNTLNYTVGVTADGTDVLADPLLVNPTTDEYEDYKYAANSPCVGAGVGGVNIGLGIAA